MLWFPEYMVAATIYFYLHLFYVILLSNTFYFLFFSECRDIRNYCFLTSLSFKNSYLCSLFKCEKLSTGLKIYINYSSIYYDQESVVTGDFFFKLFLIIDSSNHISKAKQENIFMLCTVTAYP